MFALFGFAGVSHAQIPDARAAYHGDITYDGANYSQNVTLYIETQVNTPWQYAFLSGDLYLGSWHFDVNGQIWQNGWTDLIAFDDWGDILRFQGWLNDLSWEFAKTFGGTWSVYEDALQEFVQFGTFFVSVGVPRWLF